MVVLLTKAIQQLTSFWSVVGLSGETSKGCCFRRKFDCLRSSFF